jgi:hypothetical protein
MIKAFNHAVNRIKKDIFKQAIFRQVKYKIKKVFCIKIHKTPFYIVLISINYNRYYFPALVNARKLTPLQYHNQLIYRPIDHIHLLTILSYNLA